MGSDVRSGHGPPPYYGSYDDVHIKITIVVAKEDEKITEYWWDVTPSGAQLKRSKESGKKTKGTIFWELRAYDVGTGKSLKRKIKAMEMNADSGWNKDWGKPEKGKDGCHWQMEVEVPGGTALKRFGYTIKAKIAGQPITIDPEVDFEPGE